MGANYNCTLIPSTGHETQTSIVASALRDLGYAVMHEDTPKDCHKGFSYRSNLVVFISPPGEAEWIQLISTGYYFNDSYVVDRLAQSLSKFISPAINLWSFNSGKSIGYGIYENGSQVEAQTVNSSPPHPLEDFTPLLAPPEPPTRLGKLIKDPRFDFNGFAISIRWLEEAMAALTSRFGVRAHLLDWGGVQDGDGGIVIRDGKYSIVDLPGWTAIYYEKIST
jgi:hypothetical protein